MNVGPEFYAVVMVPKMVPVLNAPDLNHAAKMAASLVEKVPPVGVFKPKLLGVWKQIPTEDAA